MGRDRTAKALTPEETFATLFRANYRRVLSFAGRRSDSRDVAEEVAAETFAIAWRRYDALPTEPLPWLLNTARKVLANHYRSASRKAEKGPHIPLDLLEVSTPEAPIAEKLADRSALAVSFAALSERDREVLALIAWDGLTVGEAAKVLGCTPARFSVRLHRARLRLMKELRANEHSWGERQRRLGGTGAAEAR